MSIVIIDNILYFPGYSNQTQLVLYELMNVLIECANWVSSIEKYFSVIGTIVNILNLIILTRKSMMTCSTNVFLVGMSLFDLITLTVNNYRTFTVYYKFYTGFCWQPLTYNAQVVELLIEPLKWATRRCSTWLGIMLGAVRIIAISKLMDSNYDFVSTISFGVYSSIVVFAMSFILSLFSCFQFTVAVMGNWTSSEEYLAECGLPENYTKPFYRLEETKLFSSNNASFRRVYMLVDGSVSHIIPCILFPVLTVFLILTLQKTATSKASVQRKNNKSKLTTKFVTIMTLTFVICEFPVGITYCGLTFSVPSSGFLNVVEYVAKYQNYLALLGTVVNIFHLSVLTRKSMMTSSTNVILIGISVSDLFSVAVIDYQYVQNLIARYSHFCYMPDGFIKTHIDWIAFSISNFSTRCSAWLGLAISFVRVVVIAKISDPNYAFVSTPKFGTIVIFLLLFFSAIFSTIYYLQYDVVKTYLWTPDATCGFPENYTEYQYAMWENKHFSQNNAILRRVFAFVNSLVTQMIPCVLFLIVTVMLIFLLRKVNKGRMFSKDDKKRGKSAVATKLVTLLTVTFFIYEFPVGVAYWMQTFATLDQGGNQIVLRVIQIFTMVFTLNTTVHWIICLTMSSQYRDTVRGMFGIKDKTTIRSSARSRRTISTATTKMA